MIRDVNTSLRRHTLSVHVRGAHLALAASRLHLLWKEYTSPSVPYFSKERDAYWALRHQLEKRFQVTCYGGQIL